MLLCNLPEDILVIVLRRCALASHDATRSLKRNLPLLAVCRQWRRLAMPLVYNRAFVQHGQHPEPASGLLTRDPNVEEPTDVAVKTNLDLIAANGCVRAVRRIDINVHCLTNPFPGWREAIQRIGSVATRWRVVELMVAMHPRSRRFEARNVDMAKFADDIAEVGDALAALMPDVRRLDCRGEFEEPFAGSVCGRLARPLYGRLAVHYADQLQVFNSIHPITVPRDCQFPRLKKFSANYERIAGYQLPQMASGELVDVCLLNGSSNHSWASFSADNDSQVIEFTKLKKLKVAYNAIDWQGGGAVRHRDGHPWKLHFPSLKRISIHCWQDICPLLEYAVLPPRMESISIDMKSAAFEDIAGLVLPEAKCLTLSIIPGSSDGPSGLPVINRILESARGSEILGLTIGDDMLSVAPESITCAALTHLTVSAPTNVDAMLAFFARLPHLIHMSLLDLDLSNIQADMSIPSADQGAVVEPVHATLRALALNYNARRQPPDMEVAVAVARYMLLRIPTLTQLLSRLTPKGPVLSFVEEYAPRYPHLRDVELQINEGMSSANTRFVLSTRGEISCHEW